MNRLAILVFYGMMSLACSAKEDGRLLPEEAGRSPSAHGSPGEGVQKAVAEESLGEIKEIRVQQPFDSGWSVVFRNDGSAKIYYGSSMGDSWTTAPDLFDLNLIEAELLPLVKEAEGLPDLRSATFVLISRNLREMETAEKVRDGDVTRNLFVRAMRRLEGVSNVERFRQLMKYSPAFGIEGLDVREDQTGPSGPESLTLFMEANRSDQIPDDVDLSRFVIDRRAKALLDKRKATTPVKQPTVKAREGPMQRVPLVSLLAVMFAGVAWALFGKEIQAGSGRR
ncbi:hypothetical protein JIN84_05975 [Luteolibacter yonseiensis]|uniref:Transmembrane protein n=1 Tax=Luteolibacter yonseiensis TaxID=1144680 RepID=A0A934VAH2_9BACT|nr:hypothetical protein [Luteolibacter yonseiensis]MBK1815150.1 hypothetical protein [Luteolibacter yonseiensis]